MTRFISIGVLLAGCMNENIYRSYYGEPEIVGKSQNTVQIRSGFNVDPSEMANEYCGQTGRLASLIRTERTDAQGYYSIWYYSCTSG